MSCPFPNHYQTNADGRCTSHTCPAIEDCAGIDEPAVAAWPFYVVLIGPLSDGPVGYLGNVRRFCDVAAELMLAGYCPLNPAADLLECFANPALTVEIVQRRTRQLLRLAAAAPDGRRAALCLGTANGAGERSDGAWRELEDCRELGVPIAWEPGGLAAIRGSEP